MREENTNAYNTLLAAGLIDTSVDTAVDDYSPWYIQLIVAIAGWLSALFLLGYLGFFLELFDKPLVSGISGIGMITAAYFMLRDAQQLFLEHMAIVMSFAGQGLLGIFIVDQSGHSISDPLLWGGVLLLHTVLAALMPHMLHRVLSTTLAFYALQILMMLGGIAHLFEVILIGALTYIWLNELNNFKHTALMQAVGYGALVSIFAIDGSVFLLIGFIVDERVKQSLDLLWLSRLLLCGVLLYVVWILLRRAHLSVISKQGVASVMAVVAVGLISLKVWGVMSGVTVLLLGFASSNRLVLGVGIAMLLYFVSFYYYSLAVSLLEKSYYLLLLGVGLLGVFGAMKMWLPATQEARDE